MRNNFKKEKTAAVWILIFTSLLYFLSPTLFIHSHHSGQSNPSQDLAHSHIYSFLKEQNNQKSEDHEHSNILFEEFAQAGNQEDDHDKAHHHHEGKNAPTDPDLDQELIFHFKNRTIAPYSKTGEFKLFSISRTDLFLFYENSHNQFVFVQQNPFSIKSELLYSNLIDLPPPGLS